MEHCQKKGKLLDQIDDDRSAPSTSRSKVKSPHKERENFKSTLPSIYRSKIKSPQKERENLRSTLAKVIM
jgi:hypothetical protein